MPITISPLTESDIDGAITAIQQAFADDPYNIWVYNDRNKVRHMLRHYPSLTRLSWQSIYERPPIFDILCISESASLEADFLSIR